jgi:hypothetical protein
VKFAYSFQAVKHGFLHHRRPLISLEIKEEQPTPPLSNRRPKARGEQILKYRSFYFAFQRYGDKKRVMKQKSR